MRSSAARPTGVEHRLGKDQIIVSKTDPKGLLTYVNDVFVDISGYTEDELLGQPHNIVRHPDMPRCVFKLLWDRISGGTELFAYVLNLSQNGDHYWVFAHVTPSFDETGAVSGYHSNRRAPSAYAVAQVESLYRTLLAEERRHPRTPDAVAAGTALLERTLADRDTTYDELVWSLTSHGLEAAA